MVDEFSGYAGNAQIKKTKARSDYIVKNIIELFSEMQDTNPYVIFFSEKKIFLVVMRPYQGCLTTLSPTR